MSYKASIVVLLVLALFLCNNVSAGGTTFYVATDGSNSNPGTIDSPYFSIKKCLSVMMAGDICLIRGGTYSETEIGFNTTLPSGTSWTNAITVKAYPGETVIIAPGHGSAILGPAHGEGFHIWENIVFDAKGVQFGIGGAIAPHHFRFVNCEVKNATRSGILPGRGSFWEFINVDSHHNGSDNGDHGIYLTGSDNLIEGGQWHDNAGYGTHVYNMNQSTVSRNTIRNARIYNNSSGGLIITSGEDNVAYNNLIYGNKRTGASISESDASTSNKLYNNTIYDNGGYGLLIGAGSTNGEARNNIVFKNGYGVANLGANSQLSNNYTSDPLFTNPAVGDFTVRGSSATIDAGITLSWVFETDIVGTPRPLSVRFDIGAYEHTAP